MSFVRAASGEDGAEAPVRGEEKGKAGSGTAGLGFGAALEAMAREAQVVYDRSIDAGELLHAGEL
eukprot:scaffold26629_cov27-Phaeocystis_antarctica.AAC.1